LGFDPKKEDLCYTFRNEDWGAESKKKNKVGEGGRVSCRNCTQTWQEGGGGAKKVLFALIFKNEGGKGGNLRRR